MVEDDDDNDGEIEKKVVEEVDEIKVVLEEEFVLR